MTKVFRLLKRKSAALLITVFVISFMAIAMIGYMQIMTSEMEIMSNHKNSTKSLYIAEAGLQTGIRYCLDNLISDTDWSDNDGSIYSNVSFSDGTYSVEFKNGTTSTIDVESTALVNGVNRVIRQTLTKETGIPLAFNDVLYTEGNINASGARDLNVTGTQTKSGSDLPVVDYPSYQDIADTVVSGNYTFNAGTYSGIYYITGNVTIKTNVTINGTIISRKGVSARNYKNITINPASSNPAIIADNTVNLKNTRDVTISGVVFSGADGGGNFIAQDSRDLTVTGTVISGGNISFKNSRDATITYDSSLLTTPPSYISDGVASGVILSTWQDNP